MQLKLRQQEVTRIKDLQKKVSEQEAQIEDMGNKLRGYMNESIGGRSPGKTSKIA